MPLSDYVGSEWDFEEKPSIAKEYTSEFAPWTTGLGIIEGNILNVDALEKNEKVFKEHGLVNGYMNWEEYHPLEVAVDEEFVVENAILYVDAELDYDEVDGMYPLENNITITNSIVIFSQPVAIENDRSISVDIDNSFLYNFNAESDVYDDVHIDDSYIYGDIFSYGTKLPGADVNNSLIRAVDIIEPYHSKDLELGKPFGNGSYIDGGELLLPE